MDIEMRRDRDEENRSVQTKIDKDNRWGILYERILVVIENIKSNFFQGSEGNIKKILNNEMKIKNPENSSKDIERKNCANFNKKLFILKKIRFIEKTKFATNTEKDKKFKKLAKKIKKLFEGICLPLTLSKFLEVREEKKKNIEKLENELIKGDYLSKYWEKDKEAKLAEFLTPKIFNKFFRGDYVTVKTDDFDNFENKTDSLLIPLKKDLSHVRVDISIMEKESSLYKERRVIKYNSYNSTKIEYGASFDGYEPDGQKKYKIENIIGAPLIILNFDRSLIREYIKSFNKKDQEKIENIEKEILIIFYKNTKEQLQRLENVKTETNKDLKECKKELSNLKLEPIIQITLSGEKSMTPKNEKIKEKRFETEEEIKNLNDTIKILDKNIEKMGVFVKYIENVLKNNKIEID